MTFGLTIEKLLLIGLIAVMIIGPERLPAAAESLRRTIQQVRRMARTAQDRVREELKPEVSDVDWQRLDPRQYDPRRIIREALLAEPEAPSPAVRTGAASAPALDDTASREVDPGSPASTDVAASTSLDPASAAASDVPALPGLDPASAVASDVPALPGLDSASAVASDVPAVPGLDSASVPDDAEPVWEAVPVRARSTASDALRAPVPGTGEGSSR